MRRKKRSLLIVTFLLALSVWGCSSASSSESPAKDGTSQSTSAETGTPQQFTRTDFVMDTVLSETVYGTKDVTQDLKDRLSKLEKEELSWREDGSTTAKINAAAAQGTPVRVSETYAKWLSQCLTLAEKSNRAFDPTIGSLTRLWNIEGENPVVPDADAIAAALKTAGYENITIKDNVITVNADCELDLGAVGKGIGCDETARMFESDTTTSGAVIAIGGSVLTYGTKPDESAWKVAVQDPRAADGTIMGVIALEGDHNISTSGDYEKYFIQDGKRYHHILDPATGYPAESGLISVTIVSDSGLLSDGLSTACFVLGKEKGIQLLKEYGAEGVFIDSDKNVTVTDGLKDVFTILEEEYKLAQE